MRSSAQAPTGLLCQLLAHPEKTRIRARRPRFGWVVNDGRNDAVQAAYRIQVASSLGGLEWGVGDVWDSGRVESNESIDVLYAGPPLAGNAEYWWRVQTWNRWGEESPWSAVQRLRTGEVGDAYFTERYPLEKTRVEPVEVVEKGEGWFFVDFGRAAFGTVEVTLSCPEEGRRVEIHLGEKLAGPQTVDREPPGCVRYRRVELALGKGTHTYTVEILPDERNTGPHAVRMPGEVGEVLPFRYCEVAGAPSAVDRGTIRQVAVHYPFDEQAASFACADGLLNRIWELCRYSVEATSFCGVYVDGDRERIPYEADAYINQLCHYGADREFSMARVSHEYLMERPTWPTEWILFSVLLAWADYEHTGNADSLRRWYAELRAKVLLELAREDGLISSANATEEVRRAVHLVTEMRDIVDWPPGSFTQGGQGERDGYEVVPYNTVVNAFHGRALALMGRIAGVLGHSEDAEFYRARAAKVRRAMDEKLFDAERGVYVDGEGTAHASLHANMFPLAFGLVPDERVAGVVEFVESRGMACSVYGAQFLLEALYRAGRAEQVLALMTARHDRSWWNMLRAGSTVTLEAWDWKYKNNLDWNHAWGAAPGNVIPRWLMGVRPLEPGFGRVLIEPQPGGLEWARAKVPTIRGPVGVAFENRPGEPFCLEVEIPANVSARAVLPGGKAERVEVTLDGERVDVERTDRGVAIDPIGSGKHRVERL